MAGIVSAKDVALLLEVFLTVDFSASVALLKHLKTSGTSLVARKRLGTDKPHTPPTMTPKITSQKMKPKPMPHPIPKLCP